MSREVMPNDSKGRYIIFPSAHAQFRLSVQLGCTDLSHDVGRDNANGSQGSYSNPVTASAHIHLANGTKLKAHKFTRLVGIALNHLYTITATSPKCILNIRNCRSSGVGTSPESRTASKRTSRRAL